MEMVIDRDSEQIEETQKKFRLVLIITVLAPLGFAHVEKLFGGGCSAIPLLIELLILWKNYQTKAKELRPRITGKIRVVIEKPTVTQINPPSQHQLEDVRLIPSPNED